MFELYLAGAIVGLVATRGSVATRIGLALLWPLGPLAFVLVSAGLLVVAGIVFPAFGVVLAAAIGGAWWLFR